MLLLSEIDSILTAILTKLDEKTHKRIKRIPNGKFVDSFQPVPVKRSAISERYGIVYDVPERDEVVVPEGDELESENVVNNLKNEIYLLKLEMEEVRKENLIKSKGYYYYYYYYL